MPDVFHWLGISRIDRWASMSNMKHDALSAQGIAVGEQVAIPDDLIPADARVEMDAKKAAGYFAPDDSESTGRSSRQGPRARRVMNEPPRSLRFAAPRGGAQCASGGRARTDERPARVAHGERRTHAVRGDHGGGGARGHATSRVASRAAGRGGRLCRGYRATTAIRSSTSRTTAAGAISRPAVSIAGRRSPLRCPPTARSGQRTRIDLAITSVLQDAGAGDAWRYLDAATGTTLARSEGLAVAGLRLFAAGAFSARTDAPYAADARALARLDTATLAKGFQVTADNPLVGLDGRAALLRRLGVVATATPRGVRHAGAPRPSLRLSGGPIAGWRRERRVPAGNAAACAGTGLAAKARRSMASRSATAGGIRRRVPRIPPIPPTDTCRSTS